MTVAEPPVPPLVLKAERAAAAMSFGLSSTRAVGRLLAALVAAKPGGVVAESGTGTGVGTAWLAPFDIFFCDGGGKREDPAHVVDLLAPGGVLVLDDFTPYDAGWPPLHEGEPDELRITYLTDPRLVATEVRPTASAGALLAVRRAN
jgi:predicted O-methyltransferase YrrM